MEKVYDLDEKDAKRIEAYTDTLMELGLISIGMDKDNCSSKVVLEGRYSDINHAVQTIESAGIKIKPRECPLYPVDCSNAVRIQNLEPSLEIISEMNRQLLREPYCKTSGFGACPHYREKQSRKTNA